MATARHRKPENWLAAITRDGHGISEHRGLSNPEQASEALLMGLRLAEGIDLGALATRAGFASGDLIDRAKLDFYDTQGLVWSNGERIGVTEAGMPVLDALLGELVPAHLVSA